MESLAMVLCYWNGCIKYGPDGVYYEGPTSKKIKVKQKTEISRLLDGLYLIFGIDKQRSKFDILGKFPVVIQQSIVNLQAMLEVPSNHPSIKNVELYLEVKSTSDVDPAACSSPLANPSSSLKRQRTQEDMADRDSGLHGGLKKVPKPCLQDTSLWLEDDHELCFGLGRRKSVVRETEKDMYMFECVSDELVEITKYTGSHTCFPKVFELEFVANEIEDEIRVQPTLSVAEVKNWWIEKNSHKLGTLEMKEAKLDAMKNIYGDWDQSFRVLPKLMAALQSSNGLVVDWQYDVFPNPGFASFSGVFWASSQSIEGFPHCRPLILVDSKDLNNGKYPMKSMDASGLDGNNSVFSLPFAVTKKVSTYSWCWFLAGIREKVTQRKALCLISSPHQDILAAVGNLGLCGKNLGLITGFVWIICALSFTTFLKTIP
ncbi:hypothetical protein EUTSA_v10007693mg [Eutrema salsugineum]|uniref:Uncharacterized protein n=1 Tax=Eutrema salsugineum TaxID=72664 RepID=V4K7K6_EUTSA|nr:hypothetical protein EUTSA_v10007693mg [Eutrema salsugineum]